MKRSCSVTKTPRRLNWCVIRFRANLPFPDLLGKRPAHFLAVSPFTLSNSSTRPLSGNPSMIRTWQPQGVVSIHPFVANQYILKCVVRGIPHVQRARHIPWGDNDAVKVHPPHPSQPKRRRFPPIGDTAVQPIRRIKCFGSSECPIAASCTFCHSRSLTHRPTFAGLTQIPHLLLSNFSNRCFHRLWYEECTTCGEGQTAQSLWQQLQPTV